MEEEVFSPYFYNSKLEGVNWTLFRHLYSA
jgi:hypothetical protein